MKIVFYLVMTCLLLSGCGIVGNLDQITRLQGYSREKDEQNKEVKAVNARYDVLIKAVEQGTINNYKDQVSFLHAFGEPILKKDLPDGTQRWLYRKAIFRLSKDKVYVYFDHKTQVLKWERLPCSSFY